MNRNLESILFALDRRLHRWGVSVITRSADRPFVQPGEQVTEVFDRIYANNIWGSAESGSGSGSEVGTTATYRELLIDLLRRREISSLFDASCGDLNWMPMVLEQLPLLRYVGGDVSSEAVARASAKCPRLDIRQFDLRCDPFPKVQLWHCRHTLFHLPLDAIREVFENAASSGIEWALITTHRARYLRNKDIDWGNFRLLDLERPPFNLPPACEYLADFSVGQFPRYSGLWPIVDLRRSLER